MSTLVSNFATLSPLISNREATKFKNITAKIGKAYANLLFGLTRSSCPAIKDNRIVASARFIVVKSNDKTLNVLDLQQQGDKFNAPPALAELLQPITALSFSPFDDGLLASGNNQGLELYRIPCNVVRNSKNINIDCVTSFEGAQCKLIGFNPIVDTCLLSVAENSEILVHDLDKIKSPILRYNKIKDIHSFDWCIDASCLVVASKDVLNILDVRSLDQLSFKPSTITPAKTIHSRWLGNTPYIVSSILTQKRTKLVQLWDVRNTTKPLSTIIDTQVSGGPWLPIVDSSSFILYMVTTNDTVNPLVSHVNLRTLFDFQSQFISNSLERSVTTNQVSLTSKIIDATIVPTRSLSVKENEVTRLLLLTGSSNNNEESIIPMSYIVPSKLDSCTSYKDDLYTNVMKPDSLVSLDSWLNGSYSTKHLTTTMSLDPVIGNQIERHNINLGSFSRQYEILENELRDGDKQQLPNSSENNVCHDLCQDLEQNVRIQEMEDYNAAKKDVDSSNYLSSYMGFAGARRVEHERLFISAVSKIVDFNEKPPEKKVTKKEDSDFEDNEWSD